MKLQVADLNSFYGPAHILFDIALEVGEGEVVGTGDEACVVCPWHGSTFRLRDGVAVHGPAANDQPVLRSRVNAGVVEIAQP